MADIVLGPATANISGIRAGDKNEFEVDLTVNDEPLDLTGLTVSAQARSKSTADDVLNSVIDVTDAPNGKLMMRWPGEDVRTWLAGTAKKAGVWDMQVMNGGSDAQTLVAGNFNAEMDVTR